ncbi:MAG: hypothetical protein HKN92_09480 [Chitinophagales bacterium]|nr:hypothetical protein [Chitinophagales bacterium]
MKNLLTLFFTLALVGISYSAFANIWTVSNNANRPAQYTTIQGAIDTAANGDTILITAGSYSGFTSIKQLVMIGEGIASPEVRITNYSYINRFTPSVSAAGSKFISIRFNWYVIIDGNYSGGTGGLETIDDLLFERCYFVSNSSSNRGEVRYNGSDGGYSNHTYRNCVFYGGQYRTFEFLDTEMTNILITNCVFNNAIVDGNNNNVNGGIILRNNIFLVRTPSCAFEAMNNVLIENNIFYRSEVCGLSNSTLNNNLTFLNNVPAFPIGTSGNVGSGNLVDIDPEFTTYATPPAVANWSLSHDYTPQNALVDTSGTNGTAIGLTGGSAPTKNVKKYPKIPVVTEVNIPVSSVPVGGTLQINLKANTRD